MRHLGLFEGIGGFSLAAHWMGWKTIAWVEKESFCQQVLKKNFPNAIGHGDIKKFDGKQYKGQIDIITGGFPCQPFSVAGKQGGEADERYLWDEMFRVIREIKPSWVIGENVFGLVSMEDGGTLEKICTDLESEGYKVQPIIIPACAIGAWHRRYRVWIIANAEGKQFNGSKSQFTINKEQQKSEFRDSNIQFSANDFSKRTQREQPKQIQGVTKISWSKDVRSLEDLFRRPDIPKPIIWRNDDGFSTRVDRLKALGNSVVPQVVHEIFKIIAQHVSNNRH